MIDINRSEVLLKYMFFEAEKIFFMNNMKTMNMGDGRNDFQMFFYEYCFVVVGIFSVPSCPA
jgi:hypothetical protein